MVYNICDITYDTYIGPPSHSPPSAYVSDLSSLCLICRTRSGRCPAPLRRGARPHPRLAKALDPSKLANEPYMAYLKRKLGEWYREAPRPARKQPVVDADEPAPADDDPEDATEADAPSGGGDGGGLVIND